jgi:hypothetical protein
MITNPTIVAGIALACDRDSILASIEAGQETACIRQKLGTLSNRGLSIVLSDSESFERLVASCPPQ